MSCCKDKKYYTELCQKCREEMTSFEACEYGDHYKKFKDTFGENDSEDWFGVSVKSKCECGSESVNAPGHSSWCPKFEK